MPDFDIFGESYTILWVCPADVEVIVKSLIKHIKSKAKPNKTVLSATSYIIWVDYIDNISINSSKSEFEVVVKVKEEFAKQVNLLPNKPTQNDWNFVYEMAEK